MLPGIKKAFEYLLAEAGAALLLTVLLSLQPANCLVGKNTTTRLAYSAPATAVTFSSLTSFFSSSSSSSAGGAGGAAGRRRRRRSEGGGGARYVNVSTTTTFALTAAGLNTSTQGTISPLELNALYALYNATNGANWSWVEPLSDYGPRWNFSSSPQPTPCKKGLYWQGLNCSCPALSAVMDDDRVDDFYHDDVYDRSAALEKMSKQNEENQNRRYDVDDKAGDTSVNNESEQRFCSVTLISLSEYNLKGSLPDELGDLMHLYKLDLSTNLLFGTIPSSLFFNNTNGNSLQALDLADNYLSGTIPSFEHLHNLTEITLKNNDLTGTIPQLTQSSAKLEKLELGDNYLNGTIPALDNVGNTLVILSLSRNQLVGGLPTLDALKKLKKLKLYSNFLTGTIPNLCHIATLQQLGLNNNYLTGSIPSLANLSQLEELYLHSNKLNGTIPSLDSLSSLINLNLFDNSLSGTIPPLNGLVELQYLALYYNQLNGTIPSLVNLTNLLVLYLDNNALTGSIPSLEGQTQLEVLYLQHNALTGSIPCLNSLSQLEQLYLNNNQLLGSVPSLSNLTALVDLYLYNNSLSGSIPYSLTEATNLVYVDMHFNTLSGTVPSFIGSLTQLSWMYLAYNDLTGTLPSIEFAYMLGFSVQHNRLRGQLPTLSNVPRLRQLYVNNNIFSGTLPEISEASALQFVYLNNNALTGTIPVLKKLFRLQAFEAQHNKLSGSLDGVFDFDRNDTSSSISSNGTENIRNDTNFTLSYIPSALSIIQLSSNQLTGTIPVAIFELPLIRTFAVVSNCFHGPLPVDAMCSSLTIQSLLLDGLHSATSCRNPVLGGLIPDVYQLGGSRTGVKLSNQLHPCFFSMPHLHTLHMSGNGLTGTIPDIYPNHTGILDLALSHNRLTGSIPLALQKQKQCGSLELSYNKLSGVLDDSFTDCYRLNEQAYLDLRLNRISGDIPGSMYEVRNISILTGNMFTCNVLQNDLPRSDVGRRQYSCGSNSFNVPYYGWLVMFFTTLFVAVVVATVYKLQLRQRQKMHEATTTTSSSSGCRRGGDGVVDEEREEGEEKEEGKTSGSSSPTQTTTTTTINDASRGVENGKVVGDTYKEYNLSWRESVSFFATLWQTSVDWLRQHTTVHTAVSPSCYPSPRESSDCIINNNNNKNNYSSSSNSFNSSSSVSDTGINNSSNLKHIQRLELLCKGLRQVCACSYMYVLAVLVPLYTISGLYRSTYTYRYAWTASSSFLTGRVVVALMFITYVCYVLWIAVLYKTHVYPISPPEVFVTPDEAAEEDVVMKAQLSDEVSKPENVVLVTARRDKNNPLYTLAIVSITILNATFVLLLNAAFVWVSVYHGSSRNLFAVQVALAVVKYAWNSKLLRAVINWCVSFVESDLRVARVAHNNITLEVYLAVFNNVIAPCFVVALIDPSCYNDFLVPPQKVHAKYLYDQYECLYVDDLEKCSSSPVVGHTSFMPPFSYSYQCSASFTTHYATAFLLLCFVTGVFVPLWEMFLMHLYSKQVQVLSKTGSVHTTGTGTGTLEGGALSLATSPTLATSSPFSAAHKDQQQAEEKEGGGDISNVVHERGSETNTWLLNVVQSSMIPRLLKPLILIRDSETWSQSAKTNIASDISSDIFIDQSPIGIVAAEKLRSPLPRPRPSDHQQPVLFHSIQFLVIITVNIALLFTFGTVFPPLGFAILITILVYTHFTQYKISRFVSLIKQKRIEVTHANQVNFALANACDQIIAQLNNDCRHFVLPSPKMDWVRAFVVSSFYGVVLFDTIGDSEGLLSACCVCISMAALPVVLTVLDRFIGVLQARKVLQQQKRQDGDERRTMTTRNWDTIVEMRDTIGNQNIGSSINYEEVEENNNV